MNYKWRVDIIESERGWGQKIDEVRWFDDEMEAINFVSNYNAKNNLSYVPDWYMYASAPVKQVVP